jgi:hypothetical protein
VPGLLHEGAAVTSVLCLIITLALLCWTIAAHPSGAQCPPRWYVNGVRPSGAYECRPAVTADPDNDGTWGHRDVTPYDPAVIRGQIYCEAGTRSVVIDERTVACRAVDRR